MQTEFFKVNSHLVEQDVALNLEKVWEYAEDSTPTNWTIAINTILASTAKQNGRNYFVASKLKTSENREWLYDLVWYDNNIFGLNDVYLIVESEWKNPWGNEDYSYDIQYDFEKLILGKAIYKLMIFEGENIQENLAYIETLKKVVINCKLTNKGDRYMFSAWDKEKQAFYNDLFVT